MTKPKLNGNHVPTETPPKRRPYTAPAIISSESTLERSALACSADTDDEESGGSKLGPVCQTATLSS